MKTVYTYYLSLPNYSDKLPCFIHLSNRRTISLEIKKDASIHVHAPLFAGTGQIEAFILKNISWICKHYHPENNQTLTPLQEIQVKQLEKRFRQAAKTFFPSRCTKLVTLTGGHYTKVTIRDQKTRWGSCSQTGTLSFNYRLMMAEPAIRDYVIIHELCHLTHMNHSKEFWDMVGSILPDYRTSKKWLKEHGQELTESNYLLSLM